VTDPQKRARWSLAVAALTLTVQNGIVMAFGVLYLPLVGEFGGSRAYVAAVQSVVLLIGGFSGPLIGSLLDRFGPRRLFQLSAAVAAAGFVWASRTESLPLLFLAYGFLAGLGLSGIGSQPNMVVAALWYPRARGRAIAIADLGTGLGAFLFIPLAQTLVVLYGWRTTLVIWATLLLGVVVPANAFQRLPASGRAQAPAAGSGAEEWSVARAALTAPFWWLVFLRFVSSVGFPLINVHLIAFAVGAGVPPVRAAAALGSVSLVSLAGRLATGWLADRLGRAQALTLTYGSAIAGVASLFLMAKTGRQEWLFAYVAFYGFAQGSGGIVSSARAADLFAGSAFGSIYGWIVLASGPGEALGVWSGGAIYDLTGAYLGAFAVSAAAFALGIFAIWQVRVPARAALRSPSQ
jgi:MFS family permease